MRFDETKQGEILGTLGGMRQLGNFLGPLTFNSLFSYMLSPDSFLHMPEIVFYIVAFISFGCFVVLLALFRKMPLDDLELLTQKKLEINTEEATRLLSPDSNIPV